jgi:hypothetical protein
MATDEGFWVGEATRQRSLAAICSARGTGTALVMPTVSIDAMNKHLAEISQCVSVSAIALLILDGAGWHSSPQLIVPDNIVLLPLPPYAPELNSTENIWEYLRGNYWDHPNPSQRWVQERQIFAKGTWGGEWHPDFVPQADDIVVKEHWAQSGFASTDLDFHLKQHGITHVPSVCSPTPALSPPAASPWSWVIT